MGSFWDPRKAKKKPKCKKAAREHFARPPSAGRLPQIRPFSGKGPLRASFRAPWGPPGHPSGAPGTPKMMLSLKEFDDFHFFTVFRVCPPKSEKKRCARTAFSPKMLFWGPPALPRAPRGIPKVALFWPNARPGSRRKRACEKGTTKNEKTRRTAQCAGPPGGVEGKPSGFADQSKFHARVLHRSLALLS
jgi:hypothetical protein